MTGFKNRFAAVFSWAVAFLGRGRRKRTITKQQVLARTLALQQATTTESRVVSVPGELDVSA